MPGSIVYDRTKTVIKRHVAPRAAVPLHPEAAAFADHYGVQHRRTRNLNFTRDYLAAMQKVTLDDIRRVARQYLVEDNLTVVSLNPRGTLAAKATEAMATAAGEIEKFELANGLRLLVREDARLPLISIVAAFRGGLLAETKATNGLTRLLSKVMVKGTTTRTAEQIADTIEAVGGHPRQRRRQ